MDWLALLKIERPRTSYSTGDHREEFERDYDRAVFSSPVKRLQDKAQVFPMEPHDSVRTRLTHSLEVSTVARGLVTKVCKEFLLPSKLVVSGQDRQMEAIAATCGLLHDLGNPPFGHSGEDAIQEWFRKYFTETQLCELLDERKDLAQDFLKFEGNAQTFRIVAKLQVLADFEGLNLTFGTLSALCKYTASSLETVTDHDHAKSKMGYFTSEKDRIEVIRQKTGTGDARNPTTFLVEAADDIVYSVADIEDGIKKRILTWAELQGLLRKAQTEPALAKIIEEVLKLQALILKPSSNPSELPDDVHCAAFRTAAIRVNVEAASIAFKDHYSEIMAGAFVGELVDVGSTASFVKLLKTIGQTKIYCTPSTLKLELKGRKVIQDLLTIFWEGASQLVPGRAVKPKRFPGKVQSLLSESYRKVFNHFATTQPHLPINYYRFQLVTDYVCGMTDSFAMRLHEELTNG